MSVIDIVQERGPMTVAAFMDLALYHPELGYYARADRRSGRAGDFFTSVDVGPLFGDLLEIQFEEMSRILDGATDRTGFPGPEPRASNPDSPISGSEPGVPGAESQADVDLVEAGAGNGRLAADVLRAARERDPAFYDRIRLHLVEASASARNSQRDVLGDSADRLVASSPELPDSFEGVLFANELLDAMPVHQVVMREEGLREVFVAADAGGAVLRLIEREPSTPGLAAYLEAAGASLDLGARAEINLAAVAWVRSAARRLRRGFIVLIDYGHEAIQLYSATHAAGTLTSFTRHTMAGSETAAPEWLADPGARDITAHVDFTSVRTAAESEGCTTIALLDQTYFLMGIVAGTGFTGSTGSRDFAEPRTARALKTLVMPGGLGSTQKVLILAKGVGKPRLRGCSYRVRVT